MLSKRIILAVALLALIGVGTVFYKPVSSIYQANRRCSTVKAEAKSITQAYDDLRGLSEAFAPTVDLYRLSPESLPANASMQANDYVAIHKGIRAMQMAIMANGLDGTKQFLALQKQTEAFTEPCKAYPLFLMKSCFQIADWYSEAHTCDDEEALNRADTHLTTLLDSTIPIYSGALRIGRMGKK